MTTTTTNATLEHLPTCYTISPNFVQAEIDGVMVWYSYGTPIAFRCGGFDRVVRQNDWAQTTGRHLNHIDNGDKARRVTAEEFKKLWNDQTEAHQGRGVNFPAGKMA
jgi:hypothetical protein